MVDSNQWARTGGDRTRIRLCGSGSGWQENQAQGKDERYYPLLWLAYKCTKSSSAGFTLLESVVVLVIIGIVTAIAATSWLSFLNTWRLNAAQDQVYQIMVIARSTAKQEHRRWQASFRNDQSHVEWAVHPVNANLDMQDLDWQPLPGFVQIDDYESTLYRSTDDIYRVQFDHKGHANGRLGRLTLEGVNAHKSRRCVFVSTLIGTLRKARDRPTARSNRYCY